MALIELSHISKLYGFGNATVVALEDVSLQVEKGEFVAIMGPSGSGKSTLMNTIGLLDRPTSGKFLLDGKDVSLLGTNKRAKARRDHIGYIFQTYNLLPRMTVLENVALPLVYKNISQLTRSKRASMMLERVGLRTREYYYPNQLSGGQAQRVAIARAIVNKPTLIIADEPTGNLDSEASRKVMELLSELNRAGHTIIMVTHNEELTRYATRVIYLFDGLIQYDQTLGKFESVNLDELLSTEPASTIKPKVKSVKKTTLKKKKSTAKKKTDRKKTSKKSKVKSS